MSRWGDAGFPDNLHLSDPRKTETALMEAIKERYSYDYPIPTPLDRHNPTQYNIRSHIDWFFINELYYRSYSGLVLNNENGRYATVITWPQGNSRIIINEIFTEISDFLGIDFVPFEDRFSPKFSVRWALSRYSIINSINAFFSVDATPLLATHKVDTKSEYSGSSTEYSTESYVNNYYGWIPNYATRSVCQTVDYRHWRDGLFQKPSQTPADVSFSMYVDKVGEGQIYDSFGSDLKQGDIIQFSIKNIKPGEKRTFINEGFFGEPSITPDFYTGVYQRIYLQSQPPPVEHKYKHLQVYDGFSVFCDMRPYLQYYDPPEET